MDEIKEIALAPKFNKNQLVAILVLCFLSWAGIWGVVYIILSEHFVFP